MVVDGLDVAGIAEALVISIGTVKAHLHRIYKKAGVSGLCFNLRLYGHAILIVPSAISSARV